MAIGRDEQRDRIARVLARREAMLNPMQPLGSPRAPELLETPNFFDTEAEPAERMRDWRKRMEQQQKEDVNKPEHMLNYDQMLYAPQWMPADQPNDLSGDSYYWKLQL